MKNLTILSLLGLLTLPALADSSDDQTSPKSIILRPVRRPVDGKHAPGRPIYGEYVNPVVRVFVADSKESVYTLTISKDNLEIESVSLSGSELNAGYEVSISAPFEIELSTDAGVSYAGEVL
ncbi:MAG: hypothetical protein HDR79_09765 [Bacteroides sp.]|nr:hypothetical protein [Bacteroides sp.]